LNDQAGVLVEQVHGDTAYPDGSTILEVGCGVGAQTVELARRSPGAHFTSIDVSEISLAAARERAKREGHLNVDFHIADALSLPWRGATFDHAFVCFVLEHLSQPDEALLRLTEVVKPGGSITVIEGDHGSALPYPDDSAAHAAIRCLVTLQQAAGGDGLIGRRLQPMLLAAGLGEVTVSPRVIYADSSRPDLVESFTLKTFTSMVEGVRGEALAAGLIDAAEFDRGITALRRAAEPGGTFTYTFFKGVGRLAERPSD
jgi:SAM-dependent methyltransferase